MKARTRCCSMRSTTTASSASSAAAAAAAGTPFYLKPGALAQMRNSKITAKSIAKERKALLTELAAVVAATTAPPPQVSYESMEAIPFFGSRSTVRRPRCLVRKKLVPMAPVFAD